MRDDKFTSSVDIANPWDGDCIFLYIDWDNLKVGTLSGKTNFSFINKKARVTNFGKNPEIHLSKMAVVPARKRGKGAMIYEVAMPFKHCTKRGDQGGRPRGFHSWL